MTDPSAVDPASLIGGILNAVQGHNWIIAIGLALSGVIWLARTFGGRAWPWLLTSRGGAALTLFVAVAGAIGTALAAGVVSLQSILDGVTLSFTAAGGYGLIKKIAWPDKVLDPATQQVAVMPQTLPPDSSPVAKIVPLVALLLLASCSMLKGSTISGTVSAGSSDVTVVTGTGEVIHATLDSRQACLETAKLIRLPNTNIQCASACGSIVQADATGRAGTMTLMCSIVGGSGQLFPIVFAVKL